MKKMLIGDRLDGLMAACVSLYVAKLQINDCNLSRP